MSRHAFSAIMRDEDAFIEKYDNDDPVPQDTKGYGMDEWISTAVVGWDESLQTYFLQGPDQGEEEPAWWLGTSPGEIPTFATLCSVIRTVFGGSVDFEFVDRIER